MAHDRLRASRDIAAVLRARGRRSGHLVGLHTRSTGAQDRARIAVVASRRVGGAVERNRAKRLLREAAQRIEWPGGLDVVLVARAACAESDLISVHREIELLVASVSGELQP